VVVVDGVTQDFGLATAASRDNTASREHEQRLNQQLSSALDETRAQLSEQKTRERDVTAQLDTAWRMLESVRKELEEKRAGSGELIQQLSETQSCAASAAESAEARDRDNVAETRWLRSALGALERKLLVAEGERVELALTLESQTSEIARAKVRAIWTRSAHFAAPRGTCRILSPTPGGPSSVVFHHLVNISRPPRMARFNER